MAATVSVIIPSLDEEERIAAAVASAMAAGALEVVVADGGSRDATVDRARAAGARIVTGERMRARQMNRAAAEAKGDLLLFLHADTRLPNGGCRAVESAIEAGATFGGFRVAFAERSLRLRFAAAMINARTVITKCPWGDQAQFTGRETFLAAGGYREIPLMEDYELAVRMRKQGRSVILRETVITSGRRFLDRGVVATSLMNWRIVAAYRRGVDPAKLAEMYWR